MSEMTATVHSNLFVTVDGQDYWANQTGGYLYSGVQGCRQDQGQQVCKGLGGRGITLSLRHDQTVLDVLRNQYRVKGIRLAAVDKWGDTL